LSCFKKLTVLSVNLTWADLINTVY
jgi:hypothetical protein